jgi:cytochrome P450
LNLGLIRPYLVTEPGHVDHVLRHAEVYRREGMLWQPIQRLEGTGIAGEGPRWRTSRRALQPLFTMRHTRGLGDQVAASVAEAMDLLAARAGADPVDVLDEMMRITHRVLIGVFFGNRIAAADADRLGRAVGAAFESLSWRMLLPFVGGAVPLPGDRTFRQAVKVADEVIYPLIRGAGDSDDLVTHLVDALDEHGARLDERRIRDDLVGMFVAGTETTALTLTWLLLLLDAHPQVMRQLTAEAAEVVGDGPAQARHLPQLTQTRMALKETLRLYPVGWVLPRTVARDDVIDGVRIRRGSTVLLSPYLTHRLPHIWPDPARFDPQRFADDTPHTRTGYLPFGAGSHACLGEHFAMAEAQLAAASLLHRFRPQLVGQRSLKARLAASLHPEDRPRMLLHPRT